MAKILAFCGRSYSGKSTAASIVTELDGRFKRLAFADPLKLEYCSLSNITLEELAANKRSTQARTYRPF